MASHDAARPLLDPGILSACVAALDRHVAVEVAIPSSDTILVAEQGPEGEVVGDVPDRSRLRRAQTPQCFRLSVIRTAYERASKATRTARSTSVGQDRSVATAIRAASSAGKP